MASILIFLFSLFHPFYVSVTEINHNPKTKTLEISTKIFFDDLETDIERESKVSFDIIKPSDKAKTNELIASYLKKHLQISVNHKTLPINYMGYEIQEDAIWCYLEIPKVKAVQQITVINNVLYNLHKEQINMLNVTVNGKRQSTKLDAPNGRVSFKF